MLQTFAARVYLSPLGIFIALALLAAAIALLPLTLALLLIVGASVLITLIYLPEVGVYLLVFAIPFGSLFPLPFGGANLTAADGLLLLVIARWLARGVIRGKIFFKAPPLLLPFVIFLLAVGVSFTVALSLQAAFKELFKWIEMLLAYWLIAQEFDAVGRPAQVERILIALLLAGLAEAALGFYQFFFRAGPEGFLLFGGTNLRAFGTFEQPNPYAGYLGLIIPLAFGIILGTVANRRRWNLLILAFVSLGAMLAALFFSLSRGAWVGVGLALIAMVMLWSRRGAVLAVTLSAFIVMIAILGQLNLIPDVVSERFSTVSDYFSFQDVRGIPPNDANFAILEREAHWQSAWDMFVDHPWLGVGFGNYALVYPAYALPLWDDPLGHAHNYPLNVLAESGIVGLLGYLILWGAIFWSAWRATLSRSTGEGARWGFSRGILLGVFGVLIVLSIHNLFDDLFVHSMHIQVGITLGIMQVISQKQGYT
jgi:O-antigen ligase